MVVYLPHACQAASLLSPRGSLGILPRSPAPPAPCAGPLSKLYFGSQFAPLIIFFVMFLSIVKNNKLHHFVRFNCMQASERGGTAGSAVGLPCMRQLAKRPLGLHRLSCLFVRVHPLTADCRLPAYLPPPRLRTAPPVPPVPLRCRPSCLTLW